MPPPPELTNVDNEHEGAKTTHQRLKFKADFSLQNHLLLFYQSLNFGGGWGGVDAKLWEVRVRFGADASSLCLKQSFWKRDHVAA